MPGSQNPEAHVMGLLQSAEDFREVLGDSELAQIGYLLFIDTATAMLAVDFVKYESSVKLQTSRGGHSFSVFLNQRFETYLWSYGRKNVKSSASSLSSSVHICYYRASLFILIYFICRIGAYATEQVWMLEEQLMETALSSPLGIWS